MMTDFASPVVERPGLEDVAEEEDVFTTEGSRSAPKPGGSQEKGYDRAQEENSLLSQTEAEFAQLTFRKQVSYRPRSCIMPENSRSDGRGHRWQMMK